MSSDFENDSGAGEPIEAPREAADDVSRPRPFRSWASAQKEEGALEKLGKRISGMFARKKVEEVAAESVEGPELSLIEPSAEVPADAPAEVPWLEMDASTDLSSSAPEPEPLIDASAAAGTEDVTLPEPDAADDAVVMWTPDAPPPPKRPSFIGRLFSRGKKREPSPAPIPESSSESIPESGLEPIPETIPDPASVVGESWGGSTEEPVVEAMPELVAEPELVSEPEFVPAPELVADPATVEPFEAASEPEPEIEAAPDFEPEVVSEIAEDPIEPSAPMVTEESKRGFFSRLFGRKSTPAPLPPVVDPVDPAEELARALQADAPVVQDPAVELPVDEVPEVADPEVALPDVALPVVDAPVLDEELIRTDEHAFPPPEHIEPQQQPFASVEDALPAAEHVDVDAPVADSLPHVELEMEQPRAGLFSRLFGRKSKAAPRPSLEIEVHEDRIEAAAHALDEVSGEAFAAPAAESPVEAAFASVDDALPVEDVTPAAELAPPSVDEMRFAPPPAPEPVLDSRATLELEPFDPFAVARDDRATVETTAESRNTVEMQQQHDARSTVEVENFDTVDPPVLDFSETLEIEEKTDEFAIPSVDTERRTDEFDLQEDPSETTGEMPKQPTWWSKLLGAKAKQIARKPALAGATVVEGNPNFLFSKFRAFYNEIIRFKHQKTEFSAGFATAIVTDYAADLSPDAAAEAQSKALLTMLELQAAEANWMGGEARDRYPDAQYAMAVLADELFTYMEWDGQSAWRNHLLEMKLYRTHAADLELYRRIDKLLKERPNSHVARDLARVYLLVIAAGFQGKYRPFGLTRPLAEYRQRLFEYIHQGDALMLFAPERRIFPEAETRTLEGHAVSRFSGAQRWAAILVLLMLGYTVLAHYAWNRVSADLRDVTERIRAASSTSSVPAANASATSSTLRGPGGGAR